MHQSRIDFLAKRELAEADLPADRQPPVHDAGGDYLILRAPALPKRKPTGYPFGSLVVPQDGPRKIIAVTTRLLDFTAAAALIVLLFPALAILAIVVAVTSRNTPIFAHRRIGKGGRAFNCYKFRTMCHDAEARLEAILAADPAARSEWEEHHKLKDDPRITPIGRILRETSLDELPQLFNVLTGEMALVGPRPIVQAELPRYNRHLPSYLSVRPGLTGLWQVTCRSESSYRRRVAIDRVYAARKCLLLDLRILFATVPAVLSRKGAC